MRRFPRSEPGKPEPAKGWRITAVKRRPWGDAMIGLLSEISDEIEPDFEEEEITLNFHIAFEKLKPSLQSYFPEWEQTLVIAKGEFTEAIYTFKVTLLDAWRRIAIPSNFNLDQVAAAVVQAFDFDFEHLYRFIYKDHLGRTFEFSHPFVDIPRGKNLHAWTQACGLSRQRAILGRGQDARALLSEQ